MAQSNAIIGSVPIDSNTSKVVLDLLKEKYYNAKGKLRAGSVLFQNSLIDINGNFFDPYLKKIIKGPMVSPEGIFVPEKFRTAPPAPISINYTNMTKEKRQKYQLLTTEDPKWKIPNATATSQITPTTTSQQPTPMVTSQPPPTPMDTSQNITPPTPTTSTIFINRPSPNILTPPTPPQTTTPSPLTTTQTFTPTPIMATRITPATGAIPKITRPQTPTTPLPRLQSFDVLDNLLNVVRDVRYKDYSNIRPLEYNISGDKKREIENFVNLIKSSDIQKIYRKVFNQEYNPNIDIISLIMRMYPEDDISHGVCFRPIYNNANKKFEYACDKFVYLFAFFAKESIKISTFQFTQDELVYALVAAREYNNVDVEIIVNPGQMARYTTFAKAHACGIKIYVNCFAKNPTLHHDKYLIFDDKVLITGSYNLSQNANKNFENYVVISNSPVIESYKKRFESVKNIGSLYNPPNFGDYATNCDYN